MRKIVTILLLLSTLNGFSQQIHSIDTSWIDVMKKKNNDTLYVINFWATWCKPCVEELPFFEQLGEEFEDKKIKIILVSTDMRKDLNTRVKNFVKEKGLKQQVLFMNEINADKWINSVSESWSGAIPATWFLNPASGISYLREGELSLEELKKLIDKNITKQK